MKAAPGAMVALVALVGSSANWFPRRLLVLGRTPGLSTRRQKNVDNLQRPDPEGLRKKLKNNMLSQKHIEVPDVGHLAPSVAFHSGSSNCTAGFVTCDYGIDVDSGNSCSAACGDDCCVGFYACAGFTGDVCRDGSCAGNYSCTFAETAHIANGCRNKESCAFTHADGVTGSCHDEGSCTFAGDNAGTVERVVDSCLGFAACFDAASYGGSVGDIIDSCIGDRSCFGMGVGATIGDVIGSCQAPSACFNIVKDSNLTGGIINTCNAANACEEFGVDEPIFGALIGCCDSEAECKDLKAFPLSCIDAFVSSHALHECTVEIDDSNEVDLQCTFNSTRGVPTQAEIRVNSCDDNAGFHEVSSSMRMEEEVIAANFNVSSTLDADDKNADSITKEFCARSDMFGFDGTELISISVVKANINVLLSFGNTAVFVVDQVAVEPYEAIAAQANANQQITIQATLGDCDGGNNLDSYAVGTILSVCISVDFPGVEISSIRDVTLAEPSHSLIDTDGNTNFVTTVAGLGTASATIRTLMIASFFDTGNDSVSLSGTVDLDFVRRALSARQIQESSTNEVFTLDIPLERPKTPEFHNESSGATAISFAIYIWFIGLLAFVWA